MPVHTSEQGGGSSVDDVVAGLDSGHLELQRGAGLLHDPARHPRVAKDALRVGMGRVGAWGYKWV